MTFNFRWRQWRRLDRSLPDATLPKSTFDQFAEALARTYPSYKSLPEATAPEGLQLDLLTALARLDQIRDVGVESALGGHLLDRVFTCDVPRLRSYLTADTIEWAESLS